MNPLSRAKRILKPMQRFKAAFKDGLPVNSHQIPISPDEELIGVYENEMGDIRDSVAITSHRILLEVSRQWKSVEFAEITSIETPEPAAVEKGDTALTIRLTDGTLVIVPILGQHGKFFDIFEFSRFLARVREDAIGAR
jgi:hypothetical protein